MLKVTECVCSICEKHEPINNLAPAKVTRRRKKLHTEWISCNSCNKWVHRKCTGLTKKETLYFKNLSKQTKKEYSLSYLKTRHIFESCNIYLKPERFRKSKFTLSKIKSEILIYEHVHVLNIYQNFQILQCTE